MPRSDTSALAILSCAMRIMLAALAFAAAACLPTGVLAQHATVSASPSSFTSVGQQITFTYTIHPGAYSMTSISGTSQIKGIPISCPALPGGGTTTAFTCTSTYTVDALDDMSGTFVEFATFSGSRLGGDFTITSPTLSVGKSGGGPVVLNVSADPSPSEPGNGVTVQASISSMGCNSGLMPPGSLVVSIGSDSRTLPLVAEFPYSTGDTVSFTTGALAAGTYPLSASYAGGAGCAAGTASGSLVVEARPLAWVTPLGQSGDTLRFGIYFSAPVSGFSLGDVSRTAVAATPTYALSGSGDSYILTVSGMTAPTTVFVAVPADVAATAAGSRNLASGAPVSSTFVPAPRLTSVSPYTGTAAGGDSVTLTGAHFTGATSVSFGGVPATAFTVDSATSITATTPPSAGSGPVSVIVTTPTGSNAANALFAYRETQTISLDDPADRVFTPNDSVALVATATSGLEVSFGSTTPGVCSVAGNTATVLTGGTCTITADQFGDADYSAAPQVSQSFEIARADQSVSFADPADRVFVPNDSVALVASADSGLEVSFTSVSPTVCSVAGSGATVLTAGTCTILADQAGDASYRPAAQRSQSFEIAPAEQSISFAAPADQSFVANGPVPLSATATSGLAVGFASVTPAVCSVSGSNAVMLAAGVCTITADQGGNGDYRPAAHVSRSFAITPATQTISFAAPADTVYVAGGTVALTATASSGLPIGFASATPGICSVWGATATILAAGSCTVTADQPGDANFAAAPQVSQSFTIDPAEQAVTFTSVPPNPAFFGGSYVVSATGGGTANPVEIFSASPAICTLTGSTVNLVGVGTCTLEASQPADANHAAGSASQSFAVSPQEQVIAFAPLTITLGYIGGPDYTVVATGGASGQPVVLSVANSSAPVCEISGSVVSFIGGGTCRILANQAGTVTYAPAAQASLDILVVGNSLPIADAGPDQSGLTEGATVTLDGSASFDSDPGQTLTYAWVQVAGPTAVLSSGSDVRPNFAVPALTGGAAAETLVFQLTVNDGTGGSASDQVSIGIVDLTSPGVTLTGLPTEAQAGQPFTVTFGFSEPVLGFEAADVLVTNASLGGFAGIGATYSATITPDGAGDISVTVPAGVATDLAGNPNLGSGAVVTLSAATETEALLQTEALARNRALIQSQPDLMRFLSGGGSGGLTFSTKGTDITFDVETDTDRSLWLRLSGRWGTGDLAADRYVHGTLGAHLHRTETFILGATVQADHSEMTDGVGSVTAKGWLAGPYVVARPNDGSLIFAASYLAGRTQQSIIPLGSYVDEVTSDRRLLTLGMAQEIDLGNTLLRPRIDLAHVTEDRPTYVDGLGGLVAAGRLELTEASVGLDFETVIPVSDGSSRLTGGLSAILSRIDQDGETDRSTRGRVSLGWQRSYDSGLTLGFDAGYDGIGAAEIGSLGLDFRLGLTF